MFTSGTTGEPRAALHPTSYLLGQRSQAEHWLGARDGDLVWVTTATGWSKSARNVFVAPWLMGAAALICDARFDPAERLEVCEREGVDRPLPGADRVPDAAPARRTSGRCRSCAGRSPPASRSGAEVFEAYRVGLGPRDLRRLRADRDRAHERQPRGRRGAPGARWASRCPGVETRIAEGELQVRAATCPTFFSGYLGEDGRPELIDGEWWATGDLVRADDDGYLFHEGRRDDLITSSGYRIGPARSSRRCSATRRSPRPRPSPAPDPSAARS